MRTFDVDSKNGLNMLKTKLSRPMFLSTCANKTKCRGSLHLVEGECRPPRLFPNQWWWECSLGYVYSGHIALSTE